MSRDLSWFVPGIGTAPILIAPSTAEYHAGARGSITNTGSSFWIPSASSARAARRDSRARLATVWSATTSPCPSSEMSAMSAGASAAHRSTMSMTALKRSGTSIRNVARSSRSPSGAEARPPLP
jgi:hypothetical protein